MQVQVNGARYFFSFHHECDYEGWSTECYIKQAVPTGVILIATGRAWCAPTDQFVKDKGRKIALGRALDLFSTDPEVRKAFWRVYLGRKNSHLTHVVNGNS